MKDTVEVVARALMPRVWTNDAVAEGTGESARRRSLRSADHAVHALLDNGYIIIRRDVVTAALPDVGPDCPCAVCTAARNAWAEVNRPR